MFQEQGKCIVFTSAYDFLKYKVRAFTHCSERQERIYNVIRSEKIYFIHWSYHLYTTYYHIIYILLCSKKGLWGDPSPTTSKRDVCPLLWNTTWTFQVLLWVNCFPSLDCHVLSFPQKNTLLLCECRTEMQMVSKHFAVFAFVHRWREKLSKLPAQEGSSTLSNRKSRSLTY